MQNIETIYRELFDWNNSDPLTPLEKEYVTKHFHPAYGIDDWNNDKNKECTEKAWLKLTEEYFKLLPGANITTKTYRFRVDVSCSSFIEELFKYYVNDNTLVISSDCEHPTVKNCLKSCKNTLILSHSKDIHTFNFNLIKKAIENYNKIFVYLIGVRNDTGEIIPQSFFVKLKSLLKNKEHILVLDGVQEMFFMNRDYTIFDYILGTAHVAVRTYDTGIMFSKMSMPDVFGNKFYSWAKNYLYPLIVVLRRLPKLYRFRYLFNKYFKDKINNFSEKISIPSAIPYLFYLRLPHAKVPSDISLKIEKTNTLIMPDTTQVGGIRLRALGFITQPEVFLAAMQILLYTIKNKKLNTAKLLKLKNKRSTQISTNTQLLSIEKLRIEIINILYPLIIANILKPLSWIEENKLSFSYKDLYFSEKQLEKLLSFNIKVLLKSKQIEILIYNKKILEGIKELFTIIDRQLQILL